MTTYQSTFVAALPPATIPDRVCASSLLTSCPVGDVRYDGPPAVVAPVGRPSSGAADRVLHADPPSALDAPVELLPQLRGLGSERAARRSGPEIAGGAL